MSLFTEYLARMRRGYVPRRASLCIAGPLILVASATTIARAQTRTITDIGDFTGSNGAIPRANLLHDASGDLFGTSQDGGSDNDGVVFEVVSGSSTVTNLAEFSGANGINPYSSLIPDSSGNLFGTTQLGGANNDGVVFEYVPGSGTITDIADFNGANGSGSVAGLVMDSSGNLYGTTASGGAHGDGDVFEVVQGSGTVTDLADFDGSNGMNPQDALVLDSSGNLFGTALFGGADALGDVFEVAHGSSTITDLADFNGGNGFGGSGAEPVGSLLMDANGDLYGTATGGGGNLFELVKGTGTITDIADFNGANGSDPLAGLIMDGSGNFFGTAGSGGVNNDGDVFELASGSSTIVDLADFGGSNGRQPEGSLILDGSGDLFGTALRGGSGDIGDVFEVSTASTPEPGSLALSLGVVGLALVARRKAHRLAARRGV